MGRSKTFPRTRAGHEVAAPVASRPSGETAQAPERVAGALAPGLLLQLLGVEDVEPR